jgi:hypothetical protein
MYKIIMYSQYHYREYEYSDTEYPVLGVLRYFEYVYEKMNPKLKKICNVRPPSGGEATGSLRAV